MTVGAALPKEADGSDGIILSFILPFGCDLRCSFCFIDRRNEINSELSLTSSQYLKFIEEVYEHRNISALCIQGHEPLLPEAFPSTKKILKFGSENNIYTSLVTNGTNLERFSFELSALRPNYLAVSLDSSDAIYHDKLRGRTGAFDVTVNGLAVAARSSALRDALAVASVLVPKQVQRLLGMPELLSKLGIRRWVVNALLAVKEGAVAHPAGNADEIKTALEQLSCEASKYQVELTVDDEFSVALEQRHQPSSKSSYYWRIHRLANSGAGVLRLLPDGRCILGKSILNVSNNTEPKWVPETEHAASFLDRLSSEAN